MNDCPSYGAYTFPTDSLLGVTSLPVINGLSFEVLSWLMTVCNGVHKVLIRRLSTSRTTLIFEQGLGAIKHSCRGGSVLRHKIKVRLCLILIDFGRGTLIHLGWPIWSWVVRVRARWHARGRCCSFTRCPFQPTYLLVQNNGSGLYRRLFFPVTDKQDLTLSSSDPSCPRSRIFKITVKQVFHAGYVKAIAFKLLFIGTSLPFELHATL